LRIPTAAGQVLALGLRDPEALKAQLEPVREQLRSFGQRANSLREVQEQAGKHVKEGQAGIEPLEAMLAEKKDAGLDWEVGEIAHQLGRLFMRLERYQEAEKMFRDAIEQLRTSHASEIQRRGLHALLARALRGQGRTSSALEEASRGVETDPVGTFERTELGWVYYDLAEYDLARNAWRDALYLDPNNAALHHALGLCLLVQLDDTKDKVQRAERLSAATQLLRDALELSDRNDSSRHDTRFLLARAYGHAGRYVEQIQELRTLERAEYYPLFLQVQLADAYLGKRDLKETERRSRRAVADVLAKLAEAGAGANDAIDAPGGEQITLGTALVFARLGIAASLSEREIRLDPALVEVAQAREAVAQIEDPDLREYWGGRCDLFEGEILFRQQRIDEAIAALESALAAGPDAPIYYRLAKSLAVKLERGVPDADATPLAQRALRYCVEASRLDWVGELDDKLLALTAELEAVAKNGAAGQ
jgi:tetratricopeptide (TPR) repeat protein